MSKLLAETLVELTSKIIALENRLSVSECNEQSAEERLRRSEVEVKRLREAAEVREKRIEEKYRDAKRFAEQAEELERLNQGHHDALTYKREQIALYENFLRRYTGLTLEFKKYKALRTRPKK